MISCLDDQSVNFDLSIKPCNRAGARRKTERKYHRFRVEYKGDGIIQKNVLVQTENGIQPCPNIIIDDITGLSGTGTIYTTGKRRRWECADRLMKQLPETNNEVRAISLIRLQQSPINYRFDYCGPFYLANCSLTSIFHGSRMTEFAINQGGNKTMQTGKFPRNFNVIGAEKECDIERNKFHVQYQTLEYSRSASLHNSSRWSMYRHFRHGSRLCGRKRLEEGYRLGKDVRRNEMGQWFTEATFPFPSDLENFENDDAVEIESVHRPITLSDYIPDVVPFNKRGRRKKRIEVEWEVISLSEYILSESIKDFT